eukprot:TRINITY_DN78745_c0_g1_i1.p1 TRINITY_DN78745_c0_g1~~TRINITY_DN78745_c0_g1_i1.p1  ORF type:complete len:117 (+),score=7.72 TRINITY_DN78745_c0_g1_i1:143-493(+)
MGSQSELAASALWVAALAKRRVALDTSCPSQSSQFKCVTKLTPTWGKGGKQLWLATVSGCWFASLQSCVVSRKWQRREVKSKVKENCTQNTALCTGANMIKRGFFTHAAGVKQKFL